MLILWCEKNENQQKEARFGQFKKDWPLITWGWTPILSKAGGTLIGGGTMTSARDLAKPLDQTLIHRMLRKSGTCFGSTSKMVRFRYWPRLWSKARSSGMMRPSTSFGIRPDVPTMKCVSGNKLNDLKADSHLPQQYAFSTVDCVNAEIEKFPSLCGNATVHYGICTSVNLP